MSAILYIPPGFVCLTQAAPRQRRDWTWRLLKPDDIQRTMRHKRSQVSFVFVDRSALVEHMKWFLTQVISLERVALIHVSFYNETILHMTLKMIPCCYNLHLLNDFWRRRLRWCSSLLAMRRVLTALPKPGLLVRCSRSVNWGKPEKKKSLKAACGWIHLSKKWQGFPRSVGAHKQT